MIPNFPDFKKLELSDKSEIETITAKYRPYSDFAFTSMWSWNIENSTELSKLNGNLVAKFNDYITGKPFYSFLGINDVNDTVQKLLDLSVTNNIGPHLKLISEEAIQSLNSTTFNIEEDPNNFDYVISIKRLLPHDGTERKLSSRRKLINKFKKDHNITISLIDVEKKDIQTKLLMVFKEWESQLDVNKNESAHLRQALDKVFTINNFEDIISLGAYMDGKLVGYSINEIVRDNYALGHFQQANLDLFDGIYALLMQEISPYLDSLSCKYLNIEQDLGIEGLKRWKSSYNPEFYLKKYIISKK